MKFLRWGILLILIWANPIVSNACDGCGASVSTVSTGILPNFYKHYVGVYFMDAHFSDSHHGGASLNHDRFTTLELRTRLYLNKRWQLFAGLPIGRVQHQMDENAYAYTSLGDATLWTMYNLNVPKKSSTNQAQHLWQMGGGIKLPTGKFKHLGTDYSWTPGAQMGTGSWDGLFLTQYTWRKDNGGIQAHVSSRWNTKNTWQYRFGRRLSLGGMAFYQWEKNRFVVLPSIGAQWELAAADRQMDIVLTDTKSKTLWSQAGIDLYRGNYSVGVRCQYPMAVSTMGPQPELRLNANLYYNF